MSCNTFGYVIAQLKLIVFNKISFCLLLVITRGLLYELTILWKISISMSVTH